MTLEDFFTLTEMGDGLSSLARVGELLSMIQKLNDCVTSNLGDAVRQWSTVANVLAATDNKECLNHFLQLNGLSFLNRWLQEALNLSADVCGIVVEELISSLLSFFERSDIDYKRITASGIGVTIELLLDHKSIPIKEKAKILHDKWNNARNDDMSCHDQNKCGTGRSDQSEPSEDVQTSENCVHVVNSVVDITQCTEGTGEGKREAESAGTEFQVVNVTRCSDSTPLDSTKKERVPTSNQVLSTSTNPVNSNAVLADVNSSGSSLVSNSCQENLSVTEESSVCVAVGKPSTGTCSQFGQEGDADDQHDASVSKDVPDSVKEMDVDMREDKPCKSNQRETCSNSSSFAFSASMMPLVAAAEQTISCKLDSNNGDFASKATDHQPKAGAFEHGREKCLIAAKESNLATNLTSGFHDLSCTASILSNLSDPQLSCRREEAISSVVKDLDGEVNLKTSKDHFVTSTDFLKIVGTKANEEICQKSDLRLECLDDALEVARQVAIAVEREVVDYREPFCSSPEANSGETTGSHSPDSEEEKQDQPMTKEVGGYSSSAGKDHSGISSPEKGSEITQNVSSDQENSEQDIESPKPKVPSQESVGKSIADNRRTFDLNSDICSDEPECLLKPIVKMPINVSAPIAIVASSKGTPGLPITPLSFGGEMGWKGSAATSAFRPASPRRTPDGERSFYGPKQKSDFLEIDLNVAERVDEVADEPILVKQLPASSSLPSGDSCVEVSSRTERLNLDLNRLGDEDTSTHPLSSWKLLFQNGERSLSSASSSSSRQPSLRDFDLNDNPSLPDIGGSHNLDILSTKASESCGGLMPCDPVIKIMGSKIAVERKDNANQVQQSFLPNGAMMEPTIFARQLLPCTNMPTPAYIGLPPGPPTMSVPPYYSPGSISYMVDSRGATVIPHVTVSGGLGLPSSRAPFLLGATGMSLNMTGFGSLRPGFDLNSGMTSVEGGIREGGSFKQFFLQGHSGWMEEQTKTSTQPSSSATTLKRKEPESGWEPYPHGYKQRTSWQ